MKKNPPRSPKTPRPIDDAELPLITGGEGTTTPRDPSSGLPTGKRM